MENRKIGLDYVRAVAILCVLISHSFSFFVDPDSKIAVPFATAGVEIFFVLSGLLIGGILFSAIQKASGVISGKLLTDFWVRRWLRTIPNYLLFLVIFALIHHLLIEPRLLYYLTFTQNLAWSIRGDFFDVSWSLAVEEWFYLLMPLIAFLLYQVTKRNRSSMRPMVINRFAYLISVWSYSIYLCHVVVFKAVDRAYHILRFFPPPAFRAATAWPVVFALSAAVYYFFELPTLRFRDRRTHHRSPATETMGASAQ